METVVHHLLHLNLSTRNRRRRWTGRWPRQCGQGEGSKCRTKSLCLREPQMGPLCPGKRHSTWWCLCIYSGLLRLKNIGLISFYYITIAETFGNSIQAHFQYHKRFRLYKTLWDYVILATIAWSRRCLKPRSYKIRSTTMMGFTREPKNEYSQDVRNKLCKHSLNLFFEYGVNCIHTGTRHIT